MKNFLRLIFGCLLILFSCFSRSAVPAQVQDQPIEGLLTVQSLRTALDHATAEREQWRNNGNDVAFVKAGNRKAELHLKLCEMDFAQDAANESLAIARKFAGAEHATLLADTLILSGRSAIRRHDSRAAMSPLEEALELSNQLNYKDGEAQSLAQIAVAYFELGEHEQAEEKNNLALQILQQYANKPLEARTLTTQGEIYMVRDRVAESAAVLEQAESIWRAVGDNDELANTLIDQCFLSIRQGQWHAALVLLNEAQGLVPEPEAEPYIAGKIATTFGEVYEAYGQWETSLNYFKDALYFYRDMAHDKRAVIETSNQVGRLQARLGDYGAARDQINNALTAALEIKNNLNIGLCHEALGIVSLEATSYGLARTEFLEAINYLTLSKSQRELARVRTYLGQTEFLIGNLTAAATAYEKALISFRDTTDYTSEAALRFGLGKLAFRQGDLKKTEEHLERSIELTERLRVNASSKDLRSSFLASVHGRYETYVETLMTRYSLEKTEALAIKAFEVSESGRARALLDSLHEYPNELRKPDDPMLILRERELQKEEQKLVDQRAELIGLTGVEKEKNKIDKQLTDIKAQSETVQARLSNTNFNTLLKPINYEQTRSQLIDDETSVLSYSLGDRKSFAWLITKDGIEPYELADKTSIKIAAQQLIELLSVSGANAAAQVKLQTAIDDVSRLVLEPVATNLRTSRLIVVADDVLQYVPFQILKPNSAGEPLISRFEVVNAPSASVLAMAKRERNNRQPGTKLLIGFGDPVFSASSTRAGDNTNSGRNQTREGSSKLGKLPQLFNAKRELRSIEELVSSDSAFFVEYNATRDNLLKANLGDYRILHVATHGVLDTDQPELSGLAFSMVDSDRQSLNGFVSLPEIYNLRAPVDLVVLSACQTAVGKEIRGEGLVGLTRGFMYAGASGVVASLWKVDDRATAELMKQFYTNLLQDGMRPAAALRKAQNYIRSQKEWSSPYYWAGFTFQGDYDLNIKATHTAFTLKHIVLAGAGALVLVLVVVWFLRSRRRVLNAVSS
ncbi:MAG TPA: CHAT domain-containing protein [Pyrinomonadaceae bacterium]|nr:CHAT domain-containing protein [Pyrinomonadaceae bacterium]